jgi:hypothetical protein
MNEEISIRRRRIVFRIWLLAVTFSSLLFALLFSRGMLPFVVLGFIAAWVISFLFSLPAYAALAVLLRYFIRNTRYHVNAITAMLLVCCVALAMAVYGLFWICLDGFLYTETLQLAVLPVLAAAVALLCNYSGLRKLCRDRDFWLIEIEQLGNNQNLYEP